jgi:hypothetical protein
MTFNRIPPNQPLPGHGFSQEDIWHEQRALGCTEAQAIRSLQEAEARLDD